ncbi:hypothetical protein GW17_00031129 [Ensete ventricosum]|nr:hypothetical protein GW17_00031129 [Ensete ventricosum]
MALSRSFIDYCIWGWDNLPRAVLMYYANFISSPEGYFHTVICNAQEFRNTTVNHDLHFISWDNPPKQHPHYLTMDDMPRMVEGNAPFARKFHKDDPVLDKIDAELLFRGPNMIVPGGCACRRMLYQLGIFCLKPLFRFLVFNPSANDVLLQPISSLSLLLLCSLLCSVGLTLLPVAIAARYFSIPESCGVPHLFAANVTLHRWLLPLLLQPQQPDLYFIDKTEHHFLCFLDTNEQPLAPFWTLCLQHQAAATLLAAPKSDPNADTTAASPRTNRCLSCPLPLPHSACGELVSYERQTNLMIEGGASESLRSHSRSLLPPGVSCWI